MRLVRNTGSDRVVDIVRPHLGDGMSIDAVSPALSIFGFGELIDSLNRGPACRLVLPAGLDGHALIGTANERTARNQLQTRWLAARLLRWLNDNVTVRLAGGSVPRERSCCATDPEPPCKPCSEPLGSRLKDLAWFPGTR